MNAKKILLVSGLAAAAISANATITLTSSGTFTLGGAFAGEGVVPTYSANSSVSSIAVGGTGNGVGTLNQWWFSAVDTSGNLSTVQYSITLSGITANSTISGLITGWSFDSATGVVGATNYDTDAFYHNIDLWTNSSASTQTLTFTENVTTPGGSPTAFFKGNFQVTNLVPEPTGVAVLAIGALGLLVRRRRTSK